MYYHAKIEHSGNSHFWWNMPKEEIVNALLIPFVNGQVVVVTRSGQRSILNMKNVTYVTFYKTSEKLHKSDGRRVPEDFKSAEFQQNECTDELIEEVKGVHASSSAQSVLQMALAPPKNQVFVIMKFGSKQLDSAYEGVIKPIIENYGLKVIRIDEIQDSGKITDQVLKNIAESKYVLADLSGERPNCYYETGFAHALGKRLILTIKRTDTIHFDLAAYRFIQWDTEAELRKSLRKRFTDLEQETEH